ncbi:hypothetical protein [Chamaesiphon sp.]|uniref:hypothetical protein n=1 Tax=Chamaesiphon sp. TaxID=2814140 RepID=UPI0035945A2C
MYDLQIKIRSVRSNLPSMLDRHRAKVNFPGTAYTSHPIGHPEVPEALSPLAIGKLPQTATDISQSVRLERSR